MNVLEELKKREPIFHHPEFGATRADFENMTVDDLIEKLNDGKQKITSAFTDIGWRFDSEIKLYIVNDS